MKRRVLATLLLILMIAAMLSPAALAAGTPPSTISAPENFAASNYGGAAVYCTMSSPDDLRALSDQTDADRGFGMLILAQIDFKTDNGSWHYSSDWDDVSTYKKYTLNYYNSLNGGDKGQYLGHERLVFKSMFPDDTNVPVVDAWNSWDWFKSHSLTLRARFTILFNNKQLVISDWSTEYVLSSASKMDHSKILNTNGPTLLTSEIVTRGPTNVPWVVLQLAQHPDQIQMLNAASSNSMRTEIWLRKSGEEEFKRIGDVPFSQEKINLAVDDFFDKGQSSYDAQAYEVKVRYYMDERSYQQAGNTKYTLLYSAFSNTLSYNMPAWSDASQWATAELQKADEAGLIPDVLAGADMTKPITREEFAALAVRLYEKISEQTATPADDNPFNDTNDPEVLKAFKLGIVKGTSDITFSPKDLTNRQEVATMLSRTIRILVENLDTSTEGAPVFTDQKDISDWALEHVLFMAKLGIIKGTDGKFMPRAITTALQAAGYATTTREQAIAMSIRIFGIYGE